MSTQGEAYIFTLVVMIPILCIWKGIEFIMDKNENGKIREATVSEKIKGGIILSIGLIISLSYSVAFITYKREKRNNPEVIIIFFLTIFLAFFLYAGITQTKKQNIEEKVAGVSAITISVIIFLNLIAFIVLFFLNQEIVKNGMNVKKRKKKTLL